MRIEQKNIPEQPALRKKDKGIHYTGDTEAYVREILARDSLIRGLRALKTAQGSLHGQALVDLNEEVRRLNNNVGMKGWLCQLVWSSRVDLHLGHFPIAEGSPQAMRGFHIEVDGVYDKFVRLLTHIIVPDQGKSRTFWDNIGSDEKRNRFLLGHVYQLAEETNEHDHVILAIADERRTGFVTTDLVEIKHTPVRFKNLLHGEKSHKDI